MLPRNVNHGGAFLVDILRGGADTAYAATSSGTMGSDGYTAGATLPLANASNVIMFDYYSINGSGSYQYCANEANNLIFYPTTSHSKADRIFINNFTLTGK